MTAPGPPIRHLVIAGLMGAGKTTLAHGLSAALGWPVVDSDAQLEATTGRTARELREHEGTAELHALEARALLHALARPDPSIVCAAASTIEDPACRQALSDDAIVAIWLRGRPETLARRMSQGSHRPVYGTDPVRVLVEQAGRRDPLFASLAPIAVDIDGRTPAQVEQAARDGLVARGVPVPAGD